jgi:hypothetical protein
MRLEPNQRRFLFGIVTISLLIAVAALWVPTSWQAAVNQQGEWAGATASVTHVGLGVLRPVGLTWESSPRGFWLAFTALRAFPMFLSVTFTVAAALVARQTYRLAHSPV